MKRILLLLLTGCAAPFFARAQLRASSVGIGITTPNAAAILDVQATGRGLLIPRMDSTARAGISTPPDGLMVFQTAGRPGFWYALGGSWLYIRDKTKSGDNLGSHTATRPINLNGFRLLGAPSNTPGVGGLRISPTGLLTLATSVRALNSTGNDSDMHLSEATVSPEAATTVLWPRTSTPPSATTPSGAAATAPASTKPTSTG